MFCSYSDFGWAIAIVYVPLFHNETQVQRLNIVFLAFVLRDWTGTYDTALALTFETRTMTTHILFFGEREPTRQDNVFNEMSRRIRDRVDLAYHPALFLIVVASWLHDRCRSEVREVDADSKSLHKEILKKINDPDCSASIVRTRSFYDDIEYLKEQLNGMTIAVARGVENVKMYLQHYERIVEFIQALDEVISKLEPKIDFELFRRQGIELLESKIDFELFRRQGIELRSHAQSLANTWNLELYHYEQCEKHLAVMSNIVSHLEVSASGI